MYLHLPQPTTLVTLMDVHPERRAYIHTEQPFWNSQGVPVETFTDHFGNLSRRLTADPGLLTMSLQGIFSATRQTDPVDWSADAAPARDLPWDVLPYLAGSRYCETDLLSNLAWAQFGGIQGGWARVQAVCDYVHNRLVFSYPNARPTRTAAEALNEGTGVCRDFTHLAITLCRCLNIPARYCNGFMGDIGVPPDPAPMDFNAWFEVYLSGQWYTFDARHNIPRIGRILIARGRDAADIAMITSFGPHSLNKFHVTTEELPDSGAQAA
jgi:transglutaminase-like putative cysteine protease